MKEISIIKLNKTYGKQWGYVLRDMVKFSRKGWYQIIGDALPDIAAYRALCTTAFTRPLKDVVEEAMSEIESLKDELDEWYNNMPESFQQGSKGDELQEAIDGLDSAHGQYNEGAPEWLMELPVYAPPHEGSSRSDRCAGATNALRQAADAIEEALKKEEEGSERASDADELMNELNSVADEAEGVCFPGMY